MKEVTFIRRNIEKWKETEKVVERAASLSPDQLADAYTDLTADLAFAQTHFPTSRITIYLNNLASALHNEIYRNKREKWTRIITFWTQEVPRNMHDARRELLTSFLIFVASALIGVLSAANDPDFVRLILGNGYVDMTLDNIANGEPMAVYNGSSEVPMFLGITLNNVMVSFNCFAMGLLTSFGTGYMLLSNGIMVGAFQTFFYQHDCCGNPVLPSGCTERLRFGRLSWPVPPDWLWATAGCFPAPIPDWNLLGEERSEA